MSEGVKEQTYLCPLHIFPKDTPLDELRLPLSLLEGGIISINGLPYAILRDRDCGDLIFNYHGRLVVLRMLDFKLSARMMIDETMEGGENGQKEI